MSTEESIEISRAGPSSISVVPSDTPIQVENLSPTSSPSLSTISGAVRHHHVPLFLPLLTLLRYCSTIWLSDVVNTSFATTGIHHSCVSDSQNLFFVTLWTIN